MRCAAGGAAVESEICESEVLINWKYRFTKIKQLGNILARHLIVMAGLSFRRVRSGLVPT